MAESIEKCVAEVVVWKMDFELMVSMNSMILVFGQKLDVLKHFRKFSVSWTAVENASLVIDLLLSQETVV